jgi:hypothetical protein
VILTGWFQGAVDFGGGPLTSAGGADGFLAKYSPTGSHVWSSRFGGTGSDIPTGVAVDGSDSIFVTGRFSGTADFGGGPLTSVGGSADIFLAKYLAGGTPLWSKGLGGASSDDAAGLAVDGNGDVVVTGTFTGSVDFGGGLLVNSTGVDILVAKYSGVDGSHSWSKNFGSTFGEGVGGVAVDGGGNVILTGAILGSVNFGGGPVGTNGTYDVYVVKLTADGAHVWSKRAGALYDDHGTAVAVDGSGNVLVTGDFYTSVDFSGGVSPLTSPGGTDSFLVKFGP